MAQKARVGKQTKLAEKDKMSEEFVFLPIVPNFVSGQF
jgi:hypothetical protein